jgi:hypothetical protein
MTEAAQALIQIEDLTKVFTPTKWNSRSRRAAIRREVCCHVGTVGMRQVNLLSIIGQPTADGGRYQLNSQPVENLGFAERADSQPGNWLHFPGFNPVAISPCTKMSNCR